jgi:hypothetical protein
VRREPFWVSMVGERGVESLDSPTCELRKALALKPGCGHLDEDKGRDGLR